MASADVFDELAELQNAVRSLRHRDSVCNPDVEQRGLVRFHPRLKARRVHLAPAPVALAPHRLDVRDERTALPAARLVESRAGARRVVGLVLIDAVRLARVEPRLGLGVQRAVVGLARHLRFENALLEHGKHILAFLDVRAVKDRLPGVSMLAIPGLGLLDRLADIHVVARARAGVQVHGARQRLVPRLPVVVLGRIVAAPRGRPEPKVLER